MDVTQAEQIVRDALTYMPPEEWQRYDLATLALDRMVAGLDEWKKAAGAEAQLADEYRDALIKQKPPCPHTNLHIEWRDTHLPDAPPSAYGQWNTCADCGHTWKAV